MRSAHLALPLLLALGSALSAQTPDRAWHDRSGNIWHETMPANLQAKPAQRFARLATITRVKGLARFGPFVVTDPHGAVLNGATDASSPRQFLAMLASYPDIRQLEMRDCPGTLDDVANLRLGRMIRAAGITTFVPDHGSVRSGAVDLFVAGKFRRAARGADFGVHAWQDQEGRGPNDFSLDAPPNRMYLDYYQKMGMNRTTALRFYNLTNSSGQNGVTWLNAVEMKQFLPIAFQ